ncbi:hypothetical protein GHT09_014834 [Marmota monax]|uniref:Uncharacterized protein n=1 Tax=Marmota monax TaxID=9995 RepID=A0A834QB09_MARMO|nr:hypothetical protein GHT09_014834 [Marmota monax]
MQTAQERWPPPQLQESAGAQGRLPRAGRRLRRLPRPAGASARRTAAPQCAARSLAYAGFWTLSSPPPCGQDQYLNLPFHRRND